MSIHMLVHLGVSDLSHDFSAHTSEDTQSAVNGSVRSFYRHDRIVSSLRPWGVEGGYPPIPRVYYDHVTSTRVSIGC